MEISTCQFLVARAKNRFPYCNVHVHVTCYRIARNFQERELLQSSEKYDFVEKTFRNCSLVLAIKGCQLRRETFANSHMQNLEIVKVSQGHIVYSPCHLIYSQICEEFDQKKPEGQDKPQRLGEGLMYTVGEGLMYTVGGVNVYSR